MSLSRMCMRPLVALGVVMVLAPFQAGAVGKLSSPAVNKGQVEFEYGAVRSNDAQRSKHNEQSHEFEVEYGLTDRLGLELEIEFEKEPDGKMRSKSFEFGPTVQFYESGEYWVDSGLELAYAHATQSGASDEVKATLLLQKKWGHTMHLANMKLEQEVGSGASGGPEPKLLWSSRYLYSDMAQPGLELQSEFGKIDESKSFDAQHHYAGPALYGKLPMGLNYDASYLFGVSEAAAEGTARVHVSYKFNY